MIGLPPLTNGFFIFMIEYHKILDLSNIVYFCELDLIWKTEIFKDIPDYELMYQVSDLGRVKSLERKVKGKIGYRINKEKILKAASAKDGYLHITLRKDDKAIIKRIHILVGITFLNHIPCGMKLVLNHKNFIRSDNRRLNLEIITNRENTNQKHFKRTSEYVGVCWHKAKNRWASQIWVNGKQEKLGYFVDEVDAHNAYQRALSEL